MIENTTIFSLLHSHLYLSVVSLEGLVHGEVGGCGQPLHLPVLPALKLQHLPNMVILFMKEVVQPAFLVAMHRHLTDMYSCIQIYFIDNEP